MTGPNDDTLEELSGPVCLIAELTPASEWPAEWLELIEAAKRVRALHGFSIETMAE